MMTKAVFKSILVVLIGLVLTSCNKDLPPGEYDANEIGKIKKVIPGTIISKRLVNLHKQNTDTSANRSKGASDSSFIDTGYNQTHGVEYVIKLNSGNIISVVQSEDLKLKNKQKILVIYGRHTRVVADNGSDVY
ncbi:MAG: hypothetical protein M1486_07335 [Gammaproteobacteria bacterium]|nr:hypothetical protein [Gammaproteobacteria bacterium]